MGYMGLECVGESDMASGLKFTLTECRNRKKFPSILAKEVKTDNGQYNTSGPVNIALCMEDGVVYREDMSDETYDAVISGLELHISESKKCMKFLTDKEDRVSNKEHIDAYQRMLKFVQKKNKK